MFRMLFPLTCGLALALGGLVLLAPLADGRLGGRLVTLFARDAAVRRTGLASAVGLLVTAGVFFRAPGAPRRRRPRSGGPAGA